VLEIVHSTPLREEIWTFDVDFPEVSLYSYRALERTTTRHAFRESKRWCSSYRNGMQRADAKIA